MGIIIIILCRWCFCWTSPNGTHFSDHYLLRLRPCMWSFFFYLKHIFSVFSNEGLLLVGPLIVFICLFENIFILFFSRLKVPNIFCQGHSGSYGLCHNCQWSLWAICKWKCMAVLCSNKTLFKKVGGGPDLGHGSYFAYLFQSIKFSVDNYFQSAY